MLISVHSYFPPLVCNKIEALYTKITGKVSDTHVAMEGTEARMSCEWIPKKYWLNAVCLPRVLKGIVPLNFWVKVEGEILSFASIGGMLKAQWPRNKPTTESWPIRHRVSMAALGSMIEFA